MWPTSSVAIGETLHVLGKPLEGNHSEVVTCLAQVRCNWACDAAQMERD
jgi:hypothetical protein